MERGEDEHSAGLLSCQPARSAQHEREVSGRVELAGRRRGVELLGAARNDDDRARGRQLDELGGVLVLVDDGDVEVDDALGVCDAIVCGDELRVCGAGAGRGDDGVGEGARVGQGAVLAVAAQRVAGESDREEPGSGGTRVVRLLVLVGFDADPVDRGDVLHQ
ncbi:hypothetical protein [Mycobacterium phage Guo1]|nr:hypothetical protein DNAIII_0055 [Mycobacterium phage DNAIII]AID18450.1 hypothetical protein [Mycobacterium phage Guo1]